MTYREAALDDLPRLLEVEQLIIEAERPFDILIKAGKTHYYDIRQLIDDNNTHLIVADHSGEIVGTGYAQIRESRAARAHDYHAHLGFMYVSPDFRRQGINKDILDLLVKWCSQQDVRNLYLEVYAQNTPASRAYKNAGFEPYLEHLKFSI